jgi:hypothetical protein
VASRDLLVSNNIFLFPVLDPLRGRRRNLQTEG